MYLLCTCTCGVGDPAGVPTLSSANHVGTDTLGSAVRTDAAAWAAAALEKCGLASTKSYLFYQCSDCVVDGRRLPKRPKATAPLGAIVQVERVARPMWAAGIVAGATMAAGGEPTPGADAPPQLTDVQTDTPPQRVDTPPQVKAAGGTKAADGTKAAEGTKTAKGKEAAKGTKTAKGKEAAKGKVVEQAREPTEEEAEVLETLGIMKKTGTEGTRTVHGWTLTLKVRKVKLNETEEAPMRASRVTDIKVALSA